LVFERGQGFLFARRLQAAGVTDLWRTLSDAAVSQEAH
jgi:hypothetical protein